MSMPDLEVLAELNIISSTIMAGVRSYADLLKLSELQGAPDPIYDEESNTYKPSATIVFKSGSYTKLWLHNGEIADSMHPCILHKRPGYLMVYYYSSIMKKTNQPRIIGYDMKTGLTAVAKKWTDPLDPEWYGHAELHNTAEDFLAAIFTRDNEPFRFF